MACGDRYKHLLQASGGRTFDAPFSTWCNEPDAEAWFGQATYVFSLQRAAWNALMAIANESKDWTWTDKLEAPATAYEDLYNGLPTPSFWMAFGGGDCAEAVEQYKANILQGACVLEQLNDAITESSGGKIGQIDPGPAPPSTSKLARWLPWTLAGVGILAAVGAIVWAVRRPAPAPAPQPVRALPAPPFHPRASARRATT